MKVLITGANGQLGQEIIKEFKKKFVVIPTDTYNLDITNKKEVETFFTKEKPDVIVHCAAWTNVDAAVEDPEGAMKVNGEGTKNLCEAFRRVHRRQTTDHGPQTTDDSRQWTVDRRPALVYISTNEVFDGRKKTPYTESDKPNPINPYAKSKLVGEKYCQKILGPGCIIARSSWLYGAASKNNFPNKIINKAREQGFLNVVDDEFATPTYTPDLAWAIRRLVDKNAKGIFHVVNEGKASRYDWAKAVIDVKKLNIPVNRIKLDDFDRPSKPPKNGVLANTRARKIGIILPDWRRANETYVQKNIK